MRWLLYHHHYFHQQQGFRCAKNPEKITQLPHRSAHLKEFY